jgi:DNA replication and repair protein RecF
LLLAEREALEAARGTPPLMLLDDVMSELDADRRARLVGLLRAAGQSVITTTDLAHVPDAEGPDVTRLAITDGAIAREPA